VGVASITAWEVAVCAAISVATMDVVMASMVLAAEVRMISS
jgi:hypothetical protein